MPEIVTGVAEAGPEATNCELTFSLKLPSGRVVWASTVIPSEHLGLSVDEFLFRYGALLVEGLLGELKVADPA